MDIMEKRTLAFFGHEDRFETLALLVDYLLLTEDSAVVPYDMEQQRKEAKEFLDDLVLKLLMMLTTRRSTRRLQLSQHRTTLTKWKSFLKVIWRALIALFRIGLM